VVVVGSKSRLREYFSEEELKEIHRIKSRLVDILREFSRANTKYVVSLSLRFRVRKKRDGRIVEKYAVYYVDLDKRIRDPDVETDEFIAMRFYYDVGRGVRYVGGYESYANTSNFDESLGLLMLFLRLVIAFYIA
jgi:hypothetical protein